jgi:hypothetical protein
MRRSRSSASLAAVALALLAACSDSTGPTEDTTPFGEPLSPSQFGTEVGGTARIEIQFTSLTGPVAREIEVEPDDAEEKIVSRVTAINPTAGTLTLELGGLVVSYGATTRFRTPVNSSVSRSNWESLINAELVAGRRPSIEARRNQPATPQAPSVTTFAAADLRVTDAISDAKIEVYVDADNLADVTSPPPLAILTVFGLPVQIVSSTQIRRIVNGAPQPGANVEFEGRVTSVNVSGGTMTLSDGTVVTVTAGTIFDPDGDLVTLSAASVAVGSGKVVRVEGTGTVQSAGPPRTIAATRVKIEVDD